MKNKLLAILLNQYFIAFITSLLIIYFLPAYFSKYKLELVEKSFIGKTYGVKFEDLDNDNISEKIVGRLQNEALFLIYDSENNVIDQWTFSMKLNANRDPYWFYDTDNNGFKEVYFTTQKQDSVFLNIIEPISKNGININKRIVYVDTIHKFQNKYYAGTYGYEMSNYKFKGVNEVFFTLSTGFPGYPRKSYKYNLQSHKIKQSEHLTSVSMISGFEDINNDGHEEIMFKSYSHGNKLDSSYTLRSDSSLWLNVLDHEQNYLFEPVEIKVANSTLQVLPLKNNNEYTLIGNLHSAHKDITPSKLLVFSIKGELLREEILPDGDYDLHLNSNKNGFILFDMKSGKLDKLNSNLKSVSTKLLSSNSDLYTIDLNENKNKQWLNIPKDKSSFTIYSDSFDEGHSFDFKNFVTKPFFFGVRKTVAKNQLYVQNGDYYYLFNYDKNPYYYFKYLFYITIYLVVLGFVLINRKGQKIRIEKKRAIEKKIAELQIKNIKNQVDPHFVFNAINTISGLMLTDKKLEADEFICNFSEFMRGTLNNSNKIMCTIQEEVEFVEKYIQLQQVRFNKCFEYKITIDENVHVLEIIPKHVLYSYVENAIKHGLCTKQNGLLKINIEFKNNNLVLSIEDDGGGFNTVKKTQQNSTGNGMLIMEEMYALYAKLYKKRIKHKIEEVLNDKNEATGVKVTVSINR